MQNLYASLQSVSAIVALSFALSSAAQDQGRLETNPATVEEFVRQVHIEGVPYAEVSRVSPDTAIPVLLDMLNDPLKEEYWPNIVVTLGMLGDDRAVEPLLDFIGRGGARKRVSRSQSIAKTSAVMALGYVVNKTGNPRALAYLKEGVDPQVWEARKVRWASDLFPSQAQRDNQLAIMSALGLGLSGHPEAAEVLRTLRDPPTTRQMKALQKRVADMSNVAGDALKAHTMISREGLKRYYDRTLPSDMPHVE